MILAENKSPRAVWTLSLQSAARLSEPAHSTIALMTTLFPSSDLGGTISSLLFLFCCFLVCCHYCFSVLFR